MVADRDLADLLHRGDLDELVRAVDAAAAREDWDRVEALRTGCLEALDRTGRQLWGAAAFAAYRLALHAPPRLAVQAVVAGHDRHTLGPLTEVVAQHHDWDDLVAWLPAGPVRGVVATERVARGQDLRGDDRAEVGHLAVPARWQPWEGSPPVPTYRRDSVLAPAPELRGGGDWRRVDGPAGGSIGDPGLEDAAMALVGPWATASSGQVAVAVRDGSPDGVVAHLAAGARVRPLSTAEAVEWMTWAAASGGARGRRRGVAAGRSAVWWLLRLVVAEAVTDLQDLDDPDELEFHLADCTFLEFDTGSDHGWRLQVAMAHADGCAVAIDATDTDAGSGDGGVAETTQGW